jgi:hypothetical protein
MRFYASTLPPEVIEAVAANLTILKITNGDAPVRRTSMGFEGLR